MIELCKKHKRQRPPKGVVISVDSSGSWKSTYVLTLDGTVVHWICCCADCSTEPDKLLPHQAELVGQYLARSLKDAINGVLRRTGVPAELREETKRSLKDSVERLTSPYVAYLYQRVV